MLRLLSQRTPHKAQSRCSDMTRRVMASMAPPRSSEEKPINLLAGWPNTKLLPPQFLRAAADTVLVDESIYVPGLCYGPDEGFKPLRQAIATWLVDFYKPQYEITFEQLCITGGASQNLACILQTFSDAVYTRNVWMVSPTYFHACKIFDDGGFAGRLRAVPEDEEGINIQYLADAIERSEQNAVNSGNTVPRLKAHRPWRKIFKHIIYAVPTFSNPSGRLMTLSRREALVRLARKYDALIITDDVYDMLQWKSNLTDTTTSSHDESQAPLTHASLPRIVDIDATLDGGPKDDFGNAVSNATFSKIVAPGCRVGWAQGTAKLAWGVSQTGSSKSGGAPSQFTSTLIYQLLSEGTLTKHIDNKLNPSYARRYHIMLNAIRKYLEPLGCELISRPVKSPLGSEIHATGVDVSQTTIETDIGLAGGYFHYFTLPSSLVPGPGERETPAERICRLVAEEENVIVMAGPLFRVEGDEAEIESNAYTSDIRLSFAWEDEDKITEGVQRLGKVIAREMDKMEAL